MNQGIGSIELLAAELTRRKEAKHDYRVPTQKITFDHDQVIEGDRSDSRRNTLKMSFSDDVAPQVVNRRAQTQLAAYLHTPMPYVEMLLEKQPDILAEHLTARIRREDDTRLVRTLDGSARAFLSNRYRMIDNDEIMEAALPALLKIGGLDVMSSAVTDDHMYLQVVTKRLTFEVKKGDVVQAGIVLSNSEVGQGSVKIEPFFYRLVCTNGMISAEQSMKRYHVGRAGQELETAYETFRDDTRRQDDRAFMMKVRDAIGASFVEKNFTRLLQPMLEATERRIEAPIEKVVERVTKQYQLGDTRRSSILEALARGGDLSQWGLANAITAQANSEKDYEKVVDLERAGGEIIALEPSQWKALAAA